jgi:N-acetylglucosaminyl-diphospho-decaprenol L-rhamnosyltransferase
VNLAIVIVAYDEGDDLARGLAELGRQRREGDEVVVVHNSSDAPRVEETAALARAHPAVDRVIETGGNLGFPTAANRGAAATAAETILFLNPDTLPEPGCLDVLRAPPEEWDAWMGLVTLEDGARVNTAGGVPHYLGFSWVGRYLEPVDSIGAEPREVGFVSGACMAVRRRAFEELGGFTELFWFYVDDTDLSHRLRLAGRRFGILPAARLRHGYEFGGRGFKMRELEKNRWLMVLRCYPGPLLWLVMPAMLMLEPILLAVAAKQGWVAAKLGAIGGLIRSLPAALRERRRVQSKVTIPAAEFAAAMTADLDSPLFGRVGRSRVARALLRLYWAGVRRALG